MAHQMHKQKGYGAANSDLEGGDNQTSLSPMHSSESTTPAKPQASPRRAVGALVLGLGVLAMAYASRAPLASTVVGRR